MQLGTIDTNKLRGLTDKGVGFGKEFVGAIVGNKRLQQEGQAQQERAAAELNALGEEIKAAKHDAEAKTHEARERVAQEAKGGDNPKLGRSTGNGITETVKGKAKEVVADITDNAQLKREAEAQQDKGQAETQATKARTKAKAYEAEAKEKELEQRINQ
ncbi:MAG: hypothetical protein Q8K63_12095 [Acidimicrobiales bacterium]|nr:hypothetical protein [Acidimicrobiales bacterium]